MNEPICPWWLAWTFDNPLRRLIHPGERILRPYVRPGDQAVDIGSGMGYFSIALARLVGPDGQVLAIDLQQAMLAGARRRATRHKLERRILFHQGTPTDLGIDRKVDFALAFWMAHEVPDQAAFFGQEAAALQPGACFLFVEPRGHVSSRAFADSLREAAGAGLAVHTQPQITLSRAALLKREDFINERQT